MRPKCDVLDCPERSTVNRQGLCLCRECDKTASMARRDIHKMYQEDTRRATLLFLRLSEGIEV